MKPLLQGTDLERGTKGRGGNAVGSPTTSTPKNKQHNMSLILEKADLLSIQPGGDLSSSAVDYGETHPLIVGTILGDGYLNRYGCLTVEHGENQQEYVAWKHDTMKDLGLLSSKSLVKRVIRKDKRSLQTYVSLRFFTRSIFKRERKIFYPEGRKVLPPQLEKLLTACALAVWFMDDGGQGGNSKFGLVIDISCYQPTQHAFLQQLLFKRYNLTTSLHSARDNSSVKLFIRRKSGFDFYHLIVPYLHPSMRYKAAAFEDTPPHHPDDGVLPLDLG